MSINASTPTRVKTSSITNPTPDAANHTLVLGQVKESIEVGQRLRGDPNDSFVRVGELASALGARLVNGTIQPPTPGAAVAIAVTNSIIGTGVTGSPLQLQGDVASPGATMLYGTNGGGVKGWYAQPSGGGGSLSVSDGTHNVTAVTAITVSGAVVSGATPNATITIPVVQFNKGAGWNSSTGAIILSGVSAIDVIIPYACTLQEVDIITSGGTGSCTIDVWKAASLAAPTSGNDITGGVPPTISAGTSYSNTTLSGWTTSFAQNDRIRFTLASTSVFTSILIILRLK